MVSMLGFRVQNTLRDTAHFGWLSYLAPYKLRQELNCAAQGTIFFNIIYIFNEDLVMKLEWVIMVFGDNLFDEKKKIPKHSLNYFRKNHIEPFTNLIEDIVF